MFLAWPGHRMERRSGRTRALLWANDAARMGDAACSLRAIEALLERKRARRMLRLERWSDGEDRGRDPLG